MKFTIVATVAANGVIGHEGKMPWSIPEELKFFRGVTLGKPVIMGRQTWNSIGKPLPNRHNIVLTRHRGWTAVGCTVANSVEDVLTILQNDPKLQACEEPEAMIIGGAEIYSLFLPKIATHLCISSLLTFHIGDTLFPNVDWNQWECSSAAPFNDADAKPLFIVKRFRRKIQDEPVKQFRHPVPNIEG